MAYWIKHLVTSEMIRGQVHTIDSKDRQAWHLPVTLGYWRPPGRAIPALSVSSGLSESIS